MKAPISSSDITLGLIAGGKASRLSGVDKAWLERGGVPQVLRWQRRFSQEVSATLVSANRELDRYAVHDLIAIPDRQPDAGPLGGLDALAAASPKSTAVADVRAELHRLIMQGVLVEQASGQIDTMSPPEKLSLGERYMLRGLNLTLLSQVLFPDILDRSTAPPYVSPRLTTLKQWRDVYRYDPTTGALQGWIRYADARIANFDAEGRLLPDGPQGKSIPVLYVMNEKGMLTWRPQPEPAPVTSSSK